MNLSSSSWLTSLLNGRSTCDSIEKFGSIYIGNLKDPGSGERTHPHHVNQTTVNECTYWYITCNCSQKGYRKTFHPLTDGRHRGVQELVIYAGDSPGILNRNELSDLSFIYLASRGVYVVGARIFVHCNPTKLTQRCDCVVLAHAPLHFTAPERDI
jgi:hypothetical protein